MVKAKTFKDYNKTLRKYWKRHDWWADRSGKIHNPQFRGYYRVWLSFIIDSPEKAKEALHHPKYTKGNLLLILNEYLQDYGKRCTFDYHNSPEGTLWGVELTNEDFYWIIKQDSGKLSYMSCVGGYNLL